LVQFNISRGIVMQRPFSLYARPAELGLRNSIRFGDQADAADRSSISRLARPSVSYRGSTRLVDAIEVPEFTNRSVRRPSALPEVVWQSHIRQAEHAHHQESDHAHVDFRRSRIAHLQEASEDIMFVDIGKMAALLNSGLDEGGLGQDSDADNSAPSGVERVPLEIQIL
jgi:hypothetical protein